MIITTEMIVFATGIVGSAIVLLFFFYILSMAIKKIAENLVEEIFPKRKEKKEKGE